MQDPITPPASTTSKSKTDQIADQFKDKAQAVAGTTVEEIKIKGNQLVDQVRSLIEEGNGRRLILRKDGRTLFEVPLSVAAGGAAAAVFMAPTLAAVGAIGALVTDLSLVIEKDVIDATESTLITGADLTPPPSDPLL